MKNDQEKRETYDLFITENKREKAEAEDANPEQDLANDEVYKSQYSDGHTFNPRRAQVEGLTYTPPTDPPVLPGDTRQNAEIAAGYSVSLEEGRLAAERLPDRVQNDSELRERVYQALRQNSETGHLTNVKVQVDRGAVNLLGTVFSEDDRGVVYEIVAGIEGVTAIKNNLQTEELGDV